MKNQIIFSSLVVFNLAATTDAQRHDSFHYNLEKWGNKVNTCLKLVKSGYCLTDDDKQQMVKTIQEYLMMLARYHEFLAECRKKSYSQNPNTTDKK